MHTITRVLTSVGHIALTLMQSVNGSPVCRQQQITPNCFYRWRRFLTPSAGGTLPGANPTRRRLRTIDGFATVRVVEAPSQERALPGEGEPIRLRLAGGRELVLPASMPARRLAELLMALEGQPREREV